jgi:predicted nuclease with TOPRIM domain
MKKLVISGIACLILFGAFYVYKKTKRPVYYYDDDYYNQEELRKKKETEIRVTTSISDSSTSDSSTSDSSTKGLEDLVKQQMELTTSLSNKLTLANDSIYVLNKTLNQLKEELESKPKIKIQSSPYDNATPVVSDVNKNKTVKKSNKNFKNEKNLPIARGNDAVKLQEFFTERYDNRR